VLLNLTQPVYQVKNGSFYYGTFTSALNSTTYLSDAAVFSA